MQVFNSLQSFLNTELQGVAYRYHVASNKHLQVLLENQLFTEYTREVIRKLRITESAICKEMVVTPLSSVVWGRIHRNLNKVVTTLKRHECIKVNMLFELTDTYDFTVELNTLIR